MILVVAEKPSVARDIAQVLGARTRAEGHLRGDAYLVTWAIGHLVMLAEPHQMNPAWKQWRLADLPLLPASWPLVVSESTRAQFAIVRRLLVSKEVRSVICATDAGREGELIFRYIYEAARAKKPVQRLWISSLTPDAIGAGFRALTDGKSFDRLADAARARSRADWLVGMNLSRVYSVMYDDNLSVGRVQTPTLAMIVARELEIRAFVPEDYLEVVATFAPEAADVAGAPATDYPGTYARAGRTAHRLPPDGEEAKEIVERAKRGVAVIASVERESRRIPPPQLYDLTELQRHANRLFGFTAQRTLEIAQRLYERWKLISYPRTDSRHLSSAMVPELPGIVRAIAGPYRELLAEGTGSRPLGGRFVDDARVSDHHAILPTDATAPADLPREERAVYDLVCRRLLAAWHRDHVYAVTRVTTVVTSGAHRDRFESAGTSIEDAGWKALERGLSRPPSPGGPGAQGAVGATETMLPAGLAKGMARRVTDAKAATRRTKAPPRHTDGTLLTAMESAGRNLDEKELSQAMRERGLGTPATRAAILETLLRREYIVRAGKALEATDKGIALVERVHPHVKSAAMTGEWEAKLLRIERGELGLSAFMGEIERYVREVVGEVAAQPPPTRASDASESTRPATALTPVALARPPRPARGGDLDELLRDAFGFASFRPYQRDVCAAVAAGEDVLLVMPTGAGKSLCYQLPGLARGGTTLVVSPLIALMEDQVAQLRKRGFAAERIHSGRERAASRDACRAYLDGALDFLFIAPERLKVPGFPEMLARRPPTLVAIDEAHCISQWGHDFRPDYRMLGERLPLLRPAPIMALTATATPMVQDDIARELRLTSPRRFIHGFRRTNIGVEVVTRAPQDRADVVRRVLGDARRRPAIVYAPTRKEAEELAAKLSGKLRAAAYHAGLRTDVRDHVQSAFLAGSLDVIVATTAFGMGIDKADVRTVVHTALPATVEGYYQEIGRAGRDGAPARAVLLKSFVDTRTHDFFLERDYPAPAVLARIQAAIPAKGTTLGALASRAKVPAEVFEKAIEKLWVHGGALIDAEDNVRRGHAEWTSAYERQRAHKRDQQVRMLRYSDTPSCRMLQLVAHFGDQNDQGLACGLCDVCAPLLCVAQVFRAPTRDEENARLRILAAVQERDGLSVGQLHRDVFAGGADGNLDRRALDQVLGALAAAGDVVVVNDRFVKDGETISFQRVHRGAGAGAGQGEGPGNERSAMRMVVTPEASSSTRAPGGRGRKRGGAGKSKRPARTKRPARSGRAEPGSGNTPSPLEAELRAWRAKEAKRGRVPAFRILTDRTLVAIAEARPTSADALLALAGMGPALLAKYGTVVLALVNGRRPA